MSDEKAVFDASEPAASVPTSPQLVCAGGASASAALDLLLAVSVAVPSLSLSAPWKISEGGRM